ncbi:MAG TPA: cation:proton antiporter [Candidatus Dormibacteraeota bacterium]|nr:cation:proton antiporter [Candidatus Dormibacteraeota bacterium]
MDGTITFISDLAVALLTASVAGAVARWLGITPVLGYLVAGVAIGPFSPGYIASASTLSGLSELGLIFLLFSLGLGFSVGELRAAGWLPLLANVALMAVIGAAAGLVAHLLGFAHPLTLALALTLSSTAIGAALIEELGLHEERAGHVALALLIAQDLAAVALVVVVAAPVSELSLSGVALPLAKAVAFVAIALLVGGTLLHRLVVQILRRAPAEMLVGFFSAIALIAAWLGHLAGLSFAFGAFVAGAVTTEAAGSRMVQAIVAPFRELFVMLFFVAIGTLLDVRAVAQHWESIVILGAALLAVRFAGWTAVTRSLGWGRSTALALGAAMLPLGEFNVVLATAAHQAGRLDATETATFVGVTAASILLAAALARVLRALPHDHQALAREAGEPAPVAADVLIVGYGRVGRTVAATLRRAGVALGVVEVDRELVRLAAEEGADARFGDGRDPRTLESLISPRTKVVLVTIPDAAANAAIARRLSSRSPASIVARARGSQDVRILREAGAATVLVPETEGALVFAEAVLSALGFGGGRVDELISAQRGEMATERGDA